MLSSGLLPPGVPNEICMDSCSFSTLMPRIAKETQQSQNTPRLRALGLEGGGSWGGSLDGAAAAAGSCGMSTASFITRQLMGRLTADTGFQRPNGKRTGSRRPVRTR